MRQQFGLERLRAGGQRRSSLPDSFRTHELERRILRQPLGIVDILIACHPAVDRLAQHVSQQQLGVLRPRIGQVPGDEIAESQTFVELAHQNQTTIGGDPRSLEIHS